MPEAVNRLKTRLSWVATRASDEGLAWTAREGMLRALRGLLWLVFLPVALVLHLAGVRRLPVITQRIGHLAAEIDCFLKERALGRLPPRTWLLLAPPATVANRTLLGYWRSHLRVVEQPALAWLLRTACRPPIGAHDISHYILTQHGAAHYGRVNAEWGNRPPLLALRGEDRAWGLSMLAELGVPPGAWFVCVHVRAAGFALHDDRVHAYRNSNPEHLRPALEAIARRGGWCIQMGDPSAPPLPPVRNLVRYAHHALRNERLDVVLCALCRLFLGSSSGLYIVSSIFGVPCALANVAPITALPYAPGDIFIPKLYRSVTDRQVLPFREVLASPAADFRHSRMFQHAGLELIENSPEELAELVEEALDPSTASRPLGEAFRSLLRPHHYGYASAANISERFLERHRCLL